MSVDSEAPGSALVSVIIPVFNCAEFLDEALQSVLRQTHRPLELSVRDDGSTDTSVEVIERWIPKLAEHGIDTVLSVRRPHQLSGSDSQPSAAASAAIDCDAPPVVSEGNSALESRFTDGRIAKRHRSDEGESEGGAGPARNAAVRQSTGQWLCFLDADDFMRDDRVELQLATARRNPRAIVGSRFTRIPEGSTPRYTRWCNGLTPHELMTHRFRELTVVQPTWFVARSVFEEVGGYAASVAEDLIFFFRHIEQWLAAHNMSGPELCGREERPPPLVRLDESLVTYRYRGAASVSAGTSRELIRTLRIEALQRQVLSRGEWAKFGIWGAGKYGKAFYRGLNQECQQKVTAFYDVDESKLGVYNDHGPTRKALVRQVSSVWPCASSVSA